MGRAPSHFNYERLFRADPLYDLVLLTNWNWPYSVKGRGSAIFLHRWLKPGHPTEGCIAFDPQHLRQITERIRYSTKIIVRSQRPVPKDSRSNLIYVAPWATANSKSPDMPIDSPKSLLFWAIFASAK